jgi:hypothetical protein
VLEAGELVASCHDPASNGCIDAGPAVYPELVSGMLVVENDVEGSACDTSEPAEPPVINILFEVHESTGVPGGNVTVPFSVRADRASQGFSYSIHFDEAVLRATGTDKLFITPDGTPYEFERFEFNNDTGFVVGAAVISLADTGAVLPPNEDVDVLEFDFAIDPFAPAGSTPLEFRDGGRGTGGPVRNFLIASGQEITPSLADSFVFIDGRVNIVPDGIPFVRGDSNANGTVNISDPQFTLNFLYLGGARPLCFDAADANDDGGLDISDAVATLQFLFLGTRSLPPPNFPGLDPTPDSFVCVE